MKVQRRNGEIYDYYDFDLKMSYDLTDNKLEIYYYLIGYRLTEYGKVEKDVLKTFDSPEHAAMYHAGLIEGLEAELEARTEQDRMREEDMETIPFAPNPRVERIVKAVEEMLLFPEVMEEETYADTEICSSS